MGGGRTRGKEKPPQSPRETLDLQTVCFVSSPKDLAPNRFHCLFRLSK